MDLFRRDLRFFIESGVEGVPGEGGAFDAHRKFAHAGENLELAELGVRRLLREQSQLQTLRRHRR